MKYILQFLIAILLVAEANGQVASPVVWEKLSGPVGGDIHDIEYSAGFNKVFAIAGSDRNLYVSGDAGGTWNRVENGSDFNFLTDIEIANGTVYALTSASLMKSVNGEDWQTITPDFFTFNVNSPDVIKRLSTGRLVVLGNHGIYFSDNEGLSWTPGYSPTLGFVSEQFERTSNDLLFIVENGKPYKSANSGTAFTEFSTGLAALDQVRSITAHPTSGAIYCVTDNTIYASDGNSTWVNIKGGSISDATINTFNFGAESFVDFTSDGLGMYFIDNVNNKLHVKAVGEPPANWTLRQSNFPVGGAIVRSAATGDFSTPAATLAFFGSSSGVFKTSNGGTTTAEANSGIGAISPDEIFVDVDGNVLISASGRMLKSADVGESWSEVTNLSGSLFSLSQDRAQQRLFAITSTGVYLSGNMGENWSALSLPPGGTSGGDALFPVGDQKVFYFDGNDIYYSENEGTNWSGAIAFTGLPTGYSIYDVYCSSPEHMLVRLHDPNTTQFAFYRIALTYTGSTLSGATGTEVTNLPWPIDDIDRKFAANGNYYFATVFSNPDEIAVSQDGGATWVTHAPGQISEFYVSKNGYVFAMDSENDQIMISRDNAVSFQPSTIAGMTTETLLDVEIQPNTGRTFLAFENEFAFRSINGIILPDGVAENLSIEGATARAVALTWDDNIGNKNNFQVYHSTDGVNFVLAGTAENFCATPNDREFFVVTGLMPNTTYTFRVVAVNDAGSSAPVDIIETTTASCPTDLPDNRSWSAVNSGDSGLPIIGAPKTVGIQHLGNDRYRISDLSLGTLSDPSHYATFQLSCGNTLLEDSESEELLPNGMGTWDGTTLTLKWRACSVDEFETIQLTLNATDPAPVAPANAAAYNYSNSAIEVTWQTGLYQTTYTIERSTNAVSGFVALGTVAYPAHRYLDQDPALAPGTTYYYRIIAANDNPTPDLSPYSTNASVAFSHPLFTVSATTLAAEESISIGSYWADFDNDGFEDYITLSFNPISESGSPVIFNSDGAGDFIRTLPVGLLTKPYFFIAADDYNDDGDMDLLLMGQEQGYADLYTGNGNLSFTHVTTGLGDLASLESLGLELGSATWTDINNDGLLDLFVTGSLDGESGNVHKYLMYRQNANHSFTSIDMGQLSDDQERGSASSWADYNNDGFLDVAIANTSGPCRLYRNNGDETFSLQAGTGFDAANTFGVYWADYDNDGLLDIYAPSITLHALYSNNGDGTFTKDVSTAVSTTGTVISATWMDINNDGLLDLVTGGFVGSPTRIFMRESASPSSIIFNEIDDEKVNDPSVFHYGLSSADYDQNGYVDLAYSSFGFSETGDTPLGVDGNLMANNVREGNWSLVRLVGTTSNSSGLGAVVKISAGGKVYTRLVSGTSFVARSSGVLHFGLGSETAIDQIQVRWPGGGVQTYTNPPINALITITEDLNGPAPATHAPAHNATNVNANTLITFSLDEVGTPVAGKKFHLLLGGTTVSVDVTTLATADNITYTFTPPAKLLRNTQYNVAVDAGAFTDFYDNPSAGYTPAQWKFTTSPGPALANRTPANAATGVAANTSVVLEFDQAVQAVSEKTVRLYTSADLTDEIQFWPAQAGVISGQSVTFTIPFKLERLTTYHIGIDAGAFLSTTGLNEYAGLDAALWSFTTDGGPAATAFTPIHQATDVDANTNISITFDEDIQAVPGKPVNIYTTDNLLDPVETLDAATGAVTAGSVTFTLPSNLEPSTVYHVGVDKGAFVSAVGNNDFEGVDPAAWFFTTAPGPSVITLSPDDGDVNINSDIQLSITFDQDVLGVSGKMIKVLNAANPLEPQTIDAADVAVVGPVATVALPAKLDRATEYNVVVDEGAFVSLTGENPSEGVASWSFTTDDGPALTGLTPFNGQTNVLSNTTLTIQFDEPVVGASGKVIEIFKSTDFSTPVFSINATDAAVAGQSVTLTPDALLESSTTYNVNVEPGAFYSQSGSNDFEGINMSNWSFTTEAGPQLVSTAPFNGQFDVGSNTTISFTLDRNIFPVTGGVVSLLRTSDLSIVETFNAEDGAVAGATVTFTPTQKLESNTSYTLEIVSGAFVSDNGQPYNGLVAGSVTFTTANGPIITSLSPTNGSVDVSANTSLVITFDQSVQVGAGKKIRIYKDGNFTTEDRILDVESGSLGGPTFSFDLTTNLERATTYNVAIDAGAFTTNDGNDILEVDASLWSFTTDGGPLIMNINPLDLAIEVSLYQNLQITFDRPITAIAGKTVQVHDGTQEVLNVDVTSGSAEGTVYTLAAPLTGWPSETTLNVTIDEGAFHDEHSNEFAGLTFGWSFTTGVEDNMGPEVVLKEMPPPTLDQGFGDYSLVIEASDDSEVQGIAVFVRPVSAPSFIEFNADPTGQPSEWAALLQENAHFDAMGTEFYIQATDNLNNQRRLPETGSFTIRMNYSTPANVTNLVGFGGEIGDWKVFSIPFELENASVMAVFDELQALEEKKDFALLTIADPDRSTWKEYPAFSHFTRGQAYFINIRESRNIELPSNLAAPDNQRSNLFEMTLMPGWNMVGNPYLTPINWNEVVTYNAELSGTAATLLKYNGDGYTDNSPGLEPYEGGFVHSSASGPVVIEVPFSGQEGSGGRMGYAALGNDLASNQWKLGMFLEQGGTSYTLGGIGMSPLAEAGADDFDAVTPPRLSSYLEMNFDKRVHRQPFTRDIVPTQNEYAWEFSVASNLGGVATLRWDQAAILNSGKGLFLLDLSRQILVNMGEEGAYLFNPKESPNFKIFFGEGDDISPERVSLGEAYPNPTEGITQVAFSLPESGGLSQHVSLEVIDAMGRTAGTIMQGRMDPGYHEVSFDGKELGNGLYTYRLIVQGRQGRTVVARKLVIK